MAFSKAHHFDDVSYFQSIWCKALSHPARIKTLEFLFKNGRTPFYILRKLVPLCSTTFSQHLRELRDLGLLEADEACPHTYYTINADICSKLARITSKLNDSFESSSKFSVLEKLSTD